MIVSDREIFVSYCTMITTNQTGSRVYIISVSRYDQDKCRDAQPKLDQNQNLKTDIDVSGVRRWAGGLKTFAKTITISLRRAPSLVHSHFRHSRLLSSHSFIFCALEMRLGVAGALILNK